MECYITITIPNTNHIKLVCKKLLKNNGKVVLPFIGVYRLPDFSINSEMTNDSFLRRGYRMATSDDSQIEFKNQKVAMHGLPVTLEYQLDVYAMKRDVCDGLTAELLMFLRENPWINVQIMDMGEDAENKRKAA